MYTCVTTFLQPAVGLDSSTFVSKFNCGFQFFKGFSFFLVFLSFFFPGDFLRVKFLLFSSVHFQRECFVASSVAVMVWCQLTLVEHRTTTLIEPVTFWLSSSGVDSFSGLGGLGQMWKSLQFVYSGHWPELNFKSLRRLSFFRKLSLFVIFFYCLCCPTTMPTSQQRGARTASSATIIFKSSVSVANLQEELCCRPTPRGVSAASYLRRVPRLSIVKRNKGAALGWTD